MGASRGVRGTISDGSANESAGAEASVAAWIASNGFVGAAIVSLAGLEPFSSISPVPLSSQDMDISGKASIMRCTTSRLGLLRSLRM
jgi:hypothetical protein